MGISVYTPVRKDYMHNFLFSESMSQKVTSQLHEDIFQELISRKLHITYSFVIQRITWKKLFGNYSLGNLISIT